MYCHIKSQSSDIVFMHKCTHIRQCYRYDHVLILIMYSYLPSSRAYCVLVLDMYRHSSCTRAHHLYSYPPCTRTHHVLVPITCTRTHHVLVPIMYSCRTGRRRRRRVIVSRRSAAVRRPATTPPSMTTLTTRNVRRQLNQAKRSTLRDV